jgi:hypothetical protein
LLLRGSAAAGEFGGCVVQTVQCNETIDRFILISAVGCFGLVYLRQVVRDDRLPKGLIRRRGRVTHASPGPAAA